MQEHRDDIWLQEVMDRTWDTHFNDVPQENDVRIEFGRKAKTRLGSIKLDHKDHSVTVITMNGLFRDPEIPEFVVVSTLVHELIHYAHGFNSPLEQKHRHPHAGGVIRREYAERGVEYLYHDQKKWLKANWPAIVRANFAPSQRRRFRRTRQTIIPKPFWL
jgi:hypothetical protein